MDKLIISVKSRHSSFLNLFAEQFEKETTDRIKKDKEGNKVKVEKERYDNEFVLTILGDKEVLKRFYEENKKNLKKTKLRHKVLLKTLGIKIKQKLEV